MQQHDFLYCLVLPVPCRYSPDNLYCLYCAPARSMNITQELREYARQHTAGDAEAAAEAGMHEMSRRFKEKGAEIYAQAAGQAAVADLH